MLASSKLYDWNMANSLNMSDDADWMLHHLLFLRDFMGMMPPTEVSRSDKSLAKQLAVVSKTKRRRRKGS